MKYFLDSDMNDAINSLGVGRLAHLMLARGRFDTQAAALTSLRSNLGPYDRDGMLETVVSDYFHKEQRLTHD